MTDVTLLTAERLRQVTEYDAQTGLFRRIEHHCRATKGWYAGHKGTHGYFALSIDGKVYRAHRLAWLYTHGVWPSGQIDHINRCRTDNRLVNLRDVNQSENQINAGAMRTNKCGLRGVSWKPDMASWRATIKRNGHCTHIGYFDTAQEAHAAYLKERYQ